MDRREPSVDDDHFNMSFVRKLVPLFDDPLADNCRWSDLSNRYDDTLNNMQIYGLGQRNCLSQSSFGVTICRLI